MMEKTTRLGFVGLRNIGMSHVKPLSLFSTTHFGPILFEYRRKP